MYLPRRLSLLRAVKKTANLDLRQQKVIVVLSSDTEFDPPSKNGSWHHRSTARLLDGIPRLLEICDEHKAPATLFSEGKLVEELQELFSDLAKRHEIGCHSFAHEWLGSKRPPRWIPRNDELPVLSSGAKAEILKRAADRIEEAIGKRPRAFKAPFNSIDQPSTLHLLEQAGFETDSSLPCYNAETYRIPLAPAPTRHASESSLWAEGRMRLIEVPFMIRPRPLLFHPFDIREEIMDTVSRGMKIALESVDVQCRLDAISGRDTSLLHITSHPWEFSDIGSSIGYGDRNSRNLDKFLEEVTALYHVEFLTVSGFVKMWDEVCCRMHSGNIETTEKSN
jgi:peptidoglycan/xylan/chitin deacetylase (PgdA/CDA1 family)